MSFLRHDPDEWEVITKSTPCGSCGGDMRKCNGLCTGSASYSQQRRDPVEVAKIKAERRTREEDDILRRADAIRATRSSLEVS